ncbi:MAG: hypothetical protein ACHQ2Z_06395 [Elusimicrobiota bacterium]
MNKLWSAAALTLLVFSGARLVRAGDWHDNVDVPFVDDPSVVGAWESVDFVESPDRFDPSSRRFEGELFLHDLVFLKDGKTAESWLAWTKGSLLNLGDKTAGRYEVKKIGGNEYLFVEWKTGDYILRHEKPQYYVLKRRDGAPAAKAASTARLQDDIDLPFVDDPAVAGAWRSVDFVDEPGQFDPARRRYPDDLPLKELVFLPKGRTTQGWWTWTKGVLIHHGDRTAAKYFIKAMGGAEYMFLEWKSGDYTIRHMKPKYYVLKRTSGIRTDDIGLPFKDDPKALGRWESVDFVKTPEQFEPGRRTWQEDLYLKELVFLKDGKTTRGSWTWTKGYVLDPADKTASRYEIKVIGGTEYMFFEWKSGDYVFRGMPPCYYVLRRAAKAT